MGGAGESAIILQGFQGTYGSSNLACAPVVVSFTLCFSGSREFRQKQYRLIQQTQPAYFFTFMRHIGRWALLERRGSQDGGEISNMHHNLVAPPHIRDLMHTALKKT